MIACPCRVCHSADPHDKRLRSSVYVEHGSARIVVDAGPDFRYQMLRAGITDIDAILLTHEHKDHTGGIDDVRAFNYFLSKPIDIYATERVQKVIRKDFDYAFSATRYPGVPEIVLRTIDDAPFRIAGAEIIPYADATIRFRSPDSASAGSPISPISIASTTGRSKSYRVSNCWSSTPCDTRNTSPISRSTKPSRSADELPRAIHTSPTCPTRSDSGPKRNKNCPKESLSPTTASS